MRYHAPSGLYLAKYRVYDPGTGRWLSRDPIEEAGGVNLYAYVGGNPVSRIDSDGRFAFAIPFIALGKGVGASVASSLAGGAAMAAILSLSGDTTNNGEPVSRPDPIEAAPGNQVDTAIQQAYSNYESNTRLNCPDQDPDDRCKWLKDNAQNFPAAAVKATAKAWGCRKSRWSGGDSF
jgi:RHS repeat-associated protein